MQVRSLGQEDSPRGGHGNPFQYSCPWDSMDRGTWQATVHGIPQSQTRLKRLGTHAHCHSHKSIYGCCPYVLGQQ